MSAILKRNSKKEGENKETETPAIPKTPNDRIAELKEKLNPYMRVGVSFFKRCERVMQDQAKTKTKDLIKWNKSILEDDFDADLFEINKVAMMTKGVRYAKVSDHIQKYDDFCNVASNTDYQQVVSGRYNLYNQITHQMMPCKDERLMEIEVTLGFLKHIFGSQLTVALDYLTILYRYPTQLLPVLCLVSAENTTGKSTFLELLSKIWQENAVVLGNADFQMEFNSHYITKNLIMVDESKVSLEKEKEKERIKKMATDPVAFLQFKGVDMKKIDYCGKLIMCSNFEDNFIKINSDDVRFWVVKVGVIQGKIVGFKKKLFSEIPYFLHYIATREITHPESVERHWFSNDLLNTEARQNIIEKTKPPFEIILDEYFSEIAGNLDFNNIADEFKLTIKDVIEENKAHSKFLTATNIKAYLTKKAVAPTGKSERYDLYSYQNNTNNIFKKIGKPYKLFCADFLPKADIQENQTPAKTEEVLPF